MIRFKQGMSKSSGRRVSEMLREQRALDAKLN